MSGPFSDCRVFLLARLLGQGTSIALSIFLLLPHVRAQDTTIADPSKLERTFSQFEFFNSFQKIVLLPSGDYLVTQPLGVISPDFASRRWINVDARMGRLFAVQPDGKIIAITGIYTGETRPGFLRVSIDGTIDPTFNTAVWNQETSFRVHCLAVQPDGKILFGSDPLLGPNTTQQILTRLNIDGSVDESFSFANQNTASVTSIYIYPDGRILAGGAGTYINSPRRNGLIRLFSNGDVDPSFICDADGAVYDIHINPDGKILIGGSFTVVNGDNRMEGLARLNENGSLDASFIPQQASRLTRTIRVQSNGRIIAGRIGGGGTAERFLPSGSKDETFKARRASGSELTDIVGLALTPDDRILIGSADGLYQFSGHLRVQIPPSDQPIALDRSTDLNGPWSPFLTFPASAQTTEYIEPNYPFAPAFFRARQTP